MLSKINEYERERGMNACVKQSSQVNPITFEKNSKGKWFENFYKWNGKEFVNIKSHGVKK